MMPYAESTSVPVERTRAEIEQILNKYGCEAFSFSCMPSVARIDFAANQRLVRFTLPLPAKDEPRFQFRVVRRQKTRCNPDHAARLWEQACRQKWRALLLAIKAKLEAVAAGISLFEDEFLANVVDPVTRKTVGELMRPELALRYEGKSSAPRLLFDPGPAHPEGGADGN